MKKVVIIHGTKGSPESNWFLWLASSLKESDFTVYVPKMPTPEGQSLDSWLSVFHTEVGPVDSTTTIIGHSVGAVFLLRLLESLDTPIHCAVLVAGFTGPLGIPEYDELNSSFVNGAFNWAKIRKSAGEILCFSGDNDPYVPLAQGLEIADNLGVTPNIIPGGGHLNSEFGYNSFPVLLKRVFCCIVSDKLV